MPISDRRAGWAPLFLPVALAACSPAQQPTSRSSTPSASPTSTAAAGTTTVPCARGNAPLEPRCTVERVEDKGGIVLTLRAPDGGFRRFRIVHDGHGLVAADGAQRAAIAVIDDGTIEVRLGDDRYRLPATVKGAS